MKLHSHVSACLLVLVLSVSVISAKTVMDFEEFNLGSITIKETPDSLMSVYLGIIDAERFGTSLMIDRDKQLQAGTAWSVEGGELYVTLPVNDFSRYRYFSLRYRDLANFTVDGADVCTLQLWDGDEWWTREFKINNDNWGLVVLQLIGYPTDSQYITADDPPRYGNNSPGFTVPAWELSNVQYYIGDGIFDAVGIATARISFAAPNVIDGEIMMDDFRIFDEFSATPFYFFDGYITYVEEPATNLSYTFSVEMDMDTVNTNNITLRDETGAAAVPYILTAISNDRYDITPQASLQYDTHYSVTFAQEIVFDTGMFSLLYSNAAIPSQLLSPVTNQFMFVSNVMIGSRAGVYYDPAAGAAIRLEADSLPADSSFSISTYNDSGDITNNYILTLQGGIDILPVLDFDKKAEVVVDISGVDPLAKDDLCVYSLSAEGEYTCLGSTVDTDMDTITFSIWQSGKFVLVSDEKNIVRQDILRVNRIENPVFQSSMESAVIHVEIGQGVSMYIVRIYDETGREVYYNAGSIDSADMRFSWNGTDRNNVKLPNGVYTVEMQVRQQTVDEMEFDSWYERASQSAQVNVPLVIYAEEDQ